MKTVITTNKHDRGFDLRTGMDVSGGTLVGKVYVDGDGLVLRIYDELASVRRSPTTLGETIYSPDSVDELAAELRDEGYELEISSRDDIDELYESISLPANEPITSGNLPIGPYGLYAKTVQTTISDFTVPAGTPFQTREGLLTADEECRVAVDVDDGVYPIRESLFQRAYSRRANAT